MRAEERAPALGCCSQCFAVGSLRLGAGARNASLAPAQASANEASAAFAQEEIPCFGLGDGAQGRLASERRGDFWLKAQGQPPLSSRVPSSVLAVEDLLDYIS